MLVWKPIFLFQYSVDKRGRPVNFSSAEQLEKFYDLGSESDEDDNVDDGEEEGEKEEVVKETQPKKTKKGSNFGFFFLTSLLSNTGPFSLPYWATQVLCTC